MTSRVASDPTKRAYRPNYLLVNSIALVYKKLLHVKMCNNLDVVHTVCNVEKDVLGFLLNS